MQLSAIHAATYATIDFGDGATFCMRLSTVTEDALNHMKFYQQAGWSELGRTPLSLLLESNAVHLNAFRHWGNA